MERIQSWMRAIHFSVMASGVALAVLVGVSLAAQRHQHIAVEDGRDNLAQQRQGQRQTTALFEAREVQRSHRYVAVARLDQRLAQQLDVVGGTAAAARLGDEQRCVVQVILAAVQGVQELADDQQGGVAGVVVDVFQAQLATSLPQLPSTSVW